MTAASVWSLLLPALEICKNNSFGMKELACIPVTIGFILGALFVYLTDKFLPENVIWIFDKSCKKKKFLFYVKAFDDVSPKQLQRKYSEESLVISTSSEDSSKEKWNWWNKLYEFKWSLHYSIRE